MTDVAYDPLRYSQAGEQSIDRLFTGVANRRAGRALQQGNYQQAAGALFGNGDLGGGMAIQDRQIQQQTAQRTEAAARAAKEAELTLRVTGALREVQARNGDVIAAFDAMAPQLTQFGVAPELQTQLRSFIASDESAIDQLERLAGQKAAEWEFRDGGGGDVAAVRQTSTGGIESRLAYNAPDRPIVTAGGILLPPQQQGANDMGGAMPPITGAAIQPNLPTAGLVAAMVPITAQTESGNRDVDANGNVITSSANARGRMQVLDGTNTDPGFGVTPARDGSLEERARVGRDYLGALMGRYGNDPAKAWAAYNWGPGNLDAAIARNGGNWLEGAPRETQNYVRQNLAALNGGGGVSAAPQAPASQSMDVGGGWSLTPMQSPADRRAEEQLRLSQNADARAERASRRDEAGVRTLNAQEVAAMGLPTGSIVQQKPDGTINVVSGTNERFTEGQRTSAAYAFRVQNAANTLNRLAQNGVARPSAAILAFGEGRVRENALNQNDRNWLQAAREWLAPILRKDTGAAVTPDELVTYMGIYLPSPTDGPATLQQKARARQVAEQALRAQAGGAYDQMFPQTQTNGRSQSPVPNVPQSLWATSSPQQQQWWRENGVSGPRGSRTNPYRVNPNDVSTSYGNVREGQWYLTPDMRLLRRGPAQGQRRRR